MFNVCVSLDKDYHSLIVGVSLDIDVAPQIICKLVVYCCVAIATMLKYGFLVNE